MFLNSLLEIFLFSTRAHPVSCLMGTEGSIPACNGGGLEYDHSSPSIAYVKTPWNCAFTPAYGFLVWCLIKHTDSSWSSQQIPQLLYDPNFQYGIQKGAPLIPVLSEMNIVYIIPPFPVKSALILSSYVHCVFQVFSSL